MDDFVQAVCFGHLSWTKNIFGHIYMDKKLGQIWKQIWKKKNQHSFEHFFRSGFCGHHAPLKKTYRPSTFSFILQTKLGKDWSKKLGAGDKKPSSDKLPGIFWLLYDCSSHLDRVIFPTSYRASCIYTLLLLVFRKNIYI